MNTLTNRTQRFDAAQAPLRRAAALMVAAVLLLPGLAFGRAAPESFADLADKLLPTVVNVSTTQVVRGQQGGGGGGGVEIPQLPPGSPFEDLFREFFDRMRPDQTPRRATSLGSGFIIESDAATALIVTNNHVIAEAEEITVVLHDNTRLKAEVVGRDDKTDLALLKVTTTKKLPVTQWGDSEKARVGDWIIAIGNPFGLGGTVTAGIVSARSRNLNIGPYDDLLQTDASINRGNSGGPMFDMEGRVIGINTAIFSPSGGSVGIGFAVSSAVAKPVIDQIKSFGRTRRGWLGVRIQGVTPDIAESLGLKEPKGALISDLIDDTVKGRIDRGDVVLKINGRDIEDVRALVRVVADIAPGVDVPVIVWRKGREMTVSVKLGEREIAERNVRQASTGGAEGTGPAPRAAAALGMSLAPLSGELKERFGLPDDARGVVVTEVKDGTPAAEKRLRAGDVVVEVGQEPVSSPADIVNRIEAARKAGRKSIFMLVERQGSPRFVVLPLTN